MEFEARIMAAVLAVALFPLVAAICRQWGRTLVVAAVMSWVLVVWFPQRFVSVWSAVTPPRLLDEAAVADRPIEAPADGYITADKCQACHPHHWATWHASYHRTMTQITNADHVAGDFDDVKLEWKGAEYRIRREGDELWAEMENPDYSKAKDEPRRLKKQLVMSTGSHHFQCFWMPSGKTRILDLFPFAYQIEERRWLPFQSLFLQPPSDRLGSNSKWNSVCIRCHATHGRPGAVSPTEFDTHVAEFGIACEACHGPAEEHVRLNHGPQRRYQYHLSGRADESIVNPQRLSHVRASQVCGQCHGLTLPHSFEDDKEWYFNGAVRYRPGEDLAEKQLILKHKQNLDSPVLKWSLEHVAPSYWEDHFWSDGMIRLSGREYMGLIETPCFQRGEMSCLTCHQMHPAADDPRPLAEWANDQLKPGGEDNQTCIQCHQQFQSEEALTAHTHHAPTSTGSSCYNCHMSYTTYGLMKAIRSHQIDTPTVEASLATGRPNACNQCHLNQTLSWSADHLETWYGISKPEMPDDEQKIAASVIWSLRGDAGQRALTAWSMGWRPAREASGTPWMIPYLAQLLVDPYDAVRFIAFRSLRTLPGFEDFEYDFIGPEEDRAEARERALEIWDRRHPAAGRPAEKAILINGEGVLDRDVYYRLLHRRDDRPVVLSE